MPEAHRRNSQCDHRPEFTLIPFLQMSRHEATKILAAAIYWFRIGNGFIEYFSGNERKQ